MDVDFCLVDTLATKFVVHLFWRDTCIRQMPMARHRALSGLTVVIECRLWVDMEAVSLASQSFEQRGASTPWSPKYQKHITAIDEPLKVSKDIYPFFRLAGQERPKPTEVHQGIVGGTFW